MGLHQLMFRNHGWAWKGSTWASASDRGAAAWDGDMARHGKGSVWAGCNSWYSFGWLWKGVQQVIGAPVARGGNMAWQGLQPVISAQALWGGVRQS